MPAAICLTVTVEDIEGRLVGAIDEAANLGIDLAGGLLRVVAVLGELAAKEDLLFLLAEGKRTELAHAPFADHLAGDFSGPLDVISGAGGHGLEEDFLGDAAPHHDRQLAFQIDAVVGVLVVNGQLHGDAQGHAARNDGDLVQRVSMGNLGGDQGVSALVIGRVFLFLIGKDHGAALGTHEHLILGEFEVEHQHGLAILTGSQ